MQIVSEAIQIQTKGLLFDMDGVLISSIGSVERCWKRWAKLYNVPDAENFQVPHGVRATDVIRMLKPQFSDAEVAEGLRIIEDMEVDDTDGLAVLPGAKALLSSLPADRWAIVTSATHRLTLARLAAAGLPVPDRLISADMVKRGKPDPEPYRRGAELLGLAPADCVVVEDAPSGVGAGLAAGSRVLGVTTTHPAVELDSATWITASLEQVQARVLGDALEVEILTAR
jgi:sugar-phosphatase